MYWFSTCETLLVVWWSPSLGGLRPESDSRGPVESGIGWIPSYLEALDWQWRNMGVFSEHPERKLMPSDYFRRQVYGCFWFERESARRVLDLYPDNWMFETDFPHPTSLSDGAVSTSGKSKGWVDKHLSHWPEDLLQKVLHDNAANVYNLG